MAQSFDNPPMWSGVLTGDDHVSLVINPGTPDEIVIRMGPLVALGAAGQLAKDAQKVLKHQSETIDRYQRAVRSLNHHPKMDS